MKISILISTYIVINTVNAKLNIFYKPVDNLYTNPIAVTSPKSPEDRRKQSFFPKNLTKYVITSKPYSNTRKNTQRPIFTAKISKLKPYYVDKTTNVKYKPVTRAPLMKPIGFTVEPLQEQIPRQIIDRRVNKIVDLNKEKSEFKYNIENENRDYDKLAINVEDDIEISTGIADIDEELRPTDAVSNINKATTMRPSSIQGIAKFNYWSNVHVPSDVSNEMIDKNEFIFIKNKNNKPQNKLEKTSNNIERTTTKLISNDIKSRMKRSSNIIIEENMGTTISGYSFTGRDYDSRLHSDLMFKNIHA